MSVGLLRWLRESVLHQESLGQFARGLVFDRCEQCLRVGWCVGVEKGAEERGHCRAAKSIGDLDINLPAGMNDKEYIEVLQHLLPQVFEKARADIVFLQAGCDTLADDPLAGLKMTPQGIVRRDAMVIDACAARQIPVVMVLGGGYSSLAWQVQCASIARTLDTYGRSDKNRPYTHTE